MSHLVTSCHKNLLTSLVCVDMLHHTIRVKVSKLDWKSFERMTFWNVVFNSHLKLFLCESIATDPLKFIVGHGSRQHVRKLVVPLCTEIMIISADRPYLVL